MSRTLQAVLIIVMALRGVMGDAMAWGLVSHADSAMHVLEHHHAAANTRDAAQAGGHAVHDSQHHGTAHDAQVTGEHDCCADACGECEICPICHSVAHPALACARTLGLGHSAAPIAAAAQWTDAPLFALIEPPISLA